MKKSLLAFALIVLAGCATTSKQPAYMTATPKRIPLSQRKITTTVFTNAPGSTPQTMMPQFATQPAALPSQPTATPAATTTPTTTPPPRARIVPLSGRIASVNEKLRFVVVDFTNSRQPTIDERLSVYRVGEKVAEIKISGPYRNTTVAADIVAGEVKYGDEVKTH